MALTRHVPMEQRFVCQESIVTPKELLTGARTFFGIDHLSRYYYRYRYPFMRIERGSLTSKHEQF